MNLLLRAGAIALALLPCAAIAQTASSAAAPGGFAPMQSTCVVQADGTCAAVSTTAPLPTAPGPLAAAGSTPCMGTVTSSAVTPTTTPASCAASFAGGAARIGPLVPELGRAIRVVLRGTWSGAVAIGTSVDGCATINPLTVGGATWGSFAGNANEAVDVPTVAGVAYCATATVTSGTLTYAVRQ